MRSILNFIILTLIIETQVLAQPKKIQFKNLADTSFQVGDIISRPAIIFKRGECYLQNETIDSLKLLAKFLKNNPKLKIEISTHTDIRGKKEQNLKLTECRATNIFDYLTTILFIPTDKIEVKGYGDTKPLYNKVYFEKIWKKHPVDIKNIERLHSKNIRTEIKVEQVN
ncbi:MAG: OmpA family protein [Bacteroidota bacterium]